MKYFLWFSLMLGAFVWKGCTSASNSTGNEVLDANDFAEKMNELPAAPVIDVRNAAEFTKGHIAHAVNVDINGGKFQQEISLLDKTKPVFVYCLSGGRSAAAASQMRAMGFREVYELDGGLMKWRAARLPEVRNSFSLPATTGMTKAEFEQKIPPDKLVLVDFYADWCGPCRKMKPYLDEIAGEMKGKVELMRINADDQPQLCQDLDVTGLPTLLLYKNKKLAWVNRGYLEKADILKQLN